MLNMSSDQDSEGWRQFPLGTGLNPGRTTSSNPLGQRVTSLIQEPRQGVTSFLIPDTSTLISVVVLAVFMVRVFSRVLESNRVQTVTIGADPSVARSTFIANAKTYRNEVASSKFRSDSKLRNTVARSGLVWSSESQMNDKNEELYKQIKHTSDSPTEKKLEDKSKFLEVTSQRKYFGKFSGLGRMTDFSELIITSGMMMKDFLGDLLNWSNDSSREKLSRERHYNNIYHRRFKNDSRIKCQKDCENETASIYSRNKREISKDSWSIDEDIPSLLFSLVSFPTESSKGKPSRSFGSLSGSRNIEPAGSRQFQVPEAGNGGLSYQNIYLAIGVAATALFMLDTLYKVYQIYINTPARSLNWAPETKFIENYLHQAFGHYYVT